MALLSISVILTGLTSRALDLIGVFIINHFLLLHLELLNILACTRIFLLLLLTEYLLGYQHFNIFFSIENKHVQILVEDLNAFSVLMQISDVVLYHVRVRSKDAVLAEIFPRVVELSVAFTVAECQARIGCVEPFAASLFTIFAIIIEMILVPLLLRVFASGKLAELLWRIDIIDVVFVLS